MDIFIFNPDTDFARAEASPGYMPKKNVIALQRKFALLPVIFASPGSIVLCPDDFNKRDAKSDSSVFLSEYAKKNNIELVKLNQLSGYLSTQNDSDVRCFPWGWDLYILKSLRNNGIYESFLPSYSFIEKVKELSHRSFSRKANDFISRNYKEIIVNSAETLTSVDEVLNFAHNVDNAWLKSPWSSSGRGILRKEDSSDKKITQWASAVIKKQGCVMGEKEEEKVLDFASEWYVKDGITQYQGLSMFNISGRGKYDGNILCDQSDIVNIINQVSSQSIKMILDAQKNMLNELLAEDYSGPLGIDMMVRKDGTINPCVEINLRYTMGHAAIRAHKLWPKAKILGGSEILRF